MSDTFPNNFHVKNNEITLVEIIEKVIMLISYLSNKWKLIFVVTLLGSAVGLVMSFLIKPTYTAHLSFALVEKSSNNGLADLASSFGLSNIMGGNQNAFSGDNLLEILKSRHAIESALLSSVHFNGREQTLANAYIEINHLNNIWSKSKNSGLLKLSYPINYKRENFSRLQDSVLNSMYLQLAAPSCLTIARREKKLSLVNVDFTSCNEEFSKLFIENLMMVTYQFYRDTKTSQSRANVLMMQEKADSVKRVYELSLAKGASYSSANINMAIQTAAVPRLKEENNAQLYAAVYAEILKNLETLKLDLARETPIVQIIDKPIFPLQVNKLGKIKGVLFGGFVGGFFCVFYLIIVGLVRVKPFLR